MDGPDQIIELINHKKIEGYKFLYHNFYSSLCSLSTRFLNQPEFAEDIVQDVFMRLWKGGSKFESIKSLKAYLFVSVKNASLNASRNSSKQSSLDVPFCIDKFSIKIEDKSIEHIMIEEEYYRQIYVAMEKLTPERKRVLLLSMDGFSNKEISEKLHISINTVKSLKLRAYGVLRKELRLSVLMFLYFFIEVK